MDRGDETNYSQLASTAFNEQLPFALTILDSVFDIRWVSPGFLRILGYDEPDVLGISMVDLMHPVDLEGLAPMAAQMVELAPDLVEADAPTSAVEMPVRVKHRNGEWMAMTMTGRLVSGDGTIMMCLRQASDRHAFDAVLDSLIGGEGHTSAAIKLMLLTQAQFGVSNAWLLHDALGEVELVSSDGPANPARDWNCGFDPSVLAEYLSEIRKEPPDPGVRVHDGFWVAPVLDSKERDIIGLLVLDSPSEPNPFELFVLERTVGLASLVVARAAMDHHLHLAATTDPLTGLLNRREFERRLASSCETERDLPVALLNIDIDDFKDVNDLYGHGVGDMALQIVAQRLTTSMRPSDSVGRIGGDEFAVLCPGVGADAAAAIGRRVQAALSSTANAGGIDLQVRVSVGVAAAETLDAVPSLVLRADADMYAHKRAKV